MSVSSNTAPAQLDQEFSTSRSHVGRRNIILHITGHLDTGFSRFPCAYKQTLRRFPTFQVATTRFSRSPPDLNLVVTDFMFCLHVK